MAVVFIAFGWLGITWAFARPMRERLIGLGLLWLIGFLVSAAPGAAGLKRVFGAEPRAWLALAVLAGLITAYIKLIARLSRDKAAKAEPVVQGGSFRPVEIDRYARHILLREIGGPGQQRLKAAKVLVIGAGGLGSPALYYLAASGVGVIGVIDPDRVEGSNLQRQIIHTDDRIGMAKVFSAEKAIRALNPFIEVRPYHRAFDSQIGADLLADYDLVLDGTDNFDTRYLVNTLCVAAGKPLISGAITQWEGQVSLYHPASGGPCYQCVFPERPLPGMVPTCAEAGVASPLPGVIGAVMAMEAVKWITKAGEGLQGRLMIHDALYAETRFISAPKSPSCPVCGTRHV